MLTALIITAVILLAAFIVGFTLTRYILKPRHFTWEQGKDHEREMGAWVEGEFEARKKYTSFIDSAFDGTRLCYTWIAADKPTNKAVVIAHGFGCCTVDSYKYARLFLACDFNVLLFDHRNSGMSGGDITTLGYREKYDLRQMVDIAFSYLGESGIVGLHGESMGGAAVILEAAMDERLAFVVADCPFADMAELLTYNMRSMMKLPRFPFLQVANLYIRLRAGFFFRDVSPVSSVRAAEGLPKLPMLLIHGTEDKLIPHESSLKLFEAKAAMKRLWLCEGAFHARSIIKDPEGYSRVLFEFLDELGLCP